MAEQSSTADSPMEETTLTPEEQVLQDFRATAVGALAESIDNTPDRRPTLAIASQGITTVEDFMFVPESDLEQVCQTHVLVRVPLAESL